MFWSICNVLIVLSRDFFEKQTTGPYYIHLPYSGRSFSYLNYFILKILVPKYSQNKDGGLMGAEIFILYLVRFPGYKTR